MSLNANSSVTVFAPGSPVLIGKEPDRIEARVVSFTFSTNGHVTYEVTWWVADEPTTYTFEEWEVEEDEDSVRCEVRMNG